MPAPCIYAPALPKSCTCADPPSEPAHPLAEVEIDSFRKVIEFFRESRIAPGSIAGIAFRLLDELERVKEDRDSLRDRIRAMDGKWRQAVSFARGISAVK